MIRLANLTCPHSSRVIQAMAPKESKIQSGMRGGQQLGMKDMFKPAPKWKSIRYSFIYRTKNGQKEE